MLTPERLSKAIDHAALRPELTRDEIIAAAGEAAQHHFAAFCVLPCWVELVAERLRESDTKVCACVAFPFGANTTPTKSAEARAAVADGAREIDVVMNVGLLKSGDEAACRRDIEAVVEASALAGLTEDGEEVMVKVIIETGLLSDAEKRRAARLVKQAGADFVKTSTGFLGPGATVADVRLIRSVVGPDLGVKASGGIRSVEDARKLLEAGADRLGTSSGPALLRMLREQLEA
ncbi:MAG: deoxyribose-phosphate aldolase [Armatimonadota bacterium]